MAHHAVMHVGQFVLQHVNKTARTLHGRSEALESATLDGHVDAALEFRAALGAHDLLHGLDGRIAVVLQAQTGDRVGQPGEAKTRAAAFPPGIPQQLPDLTFDPLHPVRFRVRRDLGQDAINGLQLQVHQVVHQALGLICHGRKALMVEPCAVGERLIDEAVQVQGNETAAIPTLHGDLAAGVRAFVAETRINTTGAVSVLAVPEDHTRLCSGVGTGDQRIPEVTGLHGPGPIGLYRINGPAQGEILIRFHGPEELIAHTDAHVGTGDLGEVLLDGDELLNVRMRDVDGEHERSSPALLRYLPCGVAESLHETDGTGTCARGVADRRSGWAQRAEVEPHTATALEELCQLLVIVEDPTIAVERRGDHHTIAQRGQPVGIA